MLSVLDGKPPHFIWESVLVLFESMFKVHSFVLSNQEQIHYTVLIFSSKTINLHIQYNTISYQSDAFPQLLINFIISQSLGKLLWQMKEVNIHFSQFHII